MSLKWSDLKFTIDKEKNENVLGTKEADASSVIKQDTSREKVSGWRKSIEKNPRFHTEN